MAANSTTRLATGRDWITWFSTLKIKAKNEDLWDYLDPTKKNKLVLTSKEPIPPNIKTFRKKHSAITRATTTDTPPTSTQSIDTIIARGDDEDPSFCEGDDTAIQAQDVAELTEKGLRMYNALWTNYEHLNKRHEKFNTKIKTIQNWIIETVDKPLYRTHCKDDKSLVEWIQSLYNEFSLAANERKQNARRAYRDLLAEPRLTKITTYKAVGDWLTRWRDAINEAGDVNLQEATEPDQWLNDLTTALRYTQMESWINAYSVMQIAQVNAGTLEVGPVTADIRRAIGNQPELPKKHRVAPGAFHGAAGQDEVNNDRSLRDQRSTSRKRGRDSIGDDKGLRCPACSLRHPLARCFYAFPERRPLAFTPHNDLVERVKQRIDINEENLADRIRKIKLEKSA